MAFYPLHRMTLQYNGLFDFDGMYAMLTDWAKNYGYRWHEMEYKHKVPSPTGAEQEWKWQMTLKVTGYIKYQIIITVHSWDLLDVEVETDGQKRHLMNGRLWLWLDGTIETDYQGRFKGGKFADWLGKSYEKLIRPVETMYWDQLYYRLWGLHALLKKYFDMQAKKHVYKGYLGES